MKIAERCRELISKERIPHARSEIIPLLTVSLGVGTPIPAHGDELLQFIETVDKRLYLAKQRGRNAIIMAS